MNRIQQILLANARYKEAMAELERIKGIQDEDERMKAIQKASKVIVEVAYDRAMVYELLAFTLISSAETLLRTSSDMLMTVQKTAKYNDKFNLKKSLDKVNSLIEDFNNESAKFHEQYFKHGKVEGRDDIVPYDAIEENSNTMLHYLMFIYNALCQNNENAKKIEDFLRGLTNDKQIFSIGEIKSM